MHFNQAVNQRSVTIMGSLAGDSINAPHVVVVPHSNSGHTIPFLQFARRLASTGVLTTVVVSDKHAQELEASERNSNYRIVPLGDKTSLELSHQEWQERVRNDSEPRVIDLLEARIRELGSPSPVCIVHDMFECWTQEEADRLHIAKHLLFVSPASALSCALQSHRLYQQGLLPITRETRHLVFSDIPGLPPTAALDLPKPFKCAETYNWMRHRHAKFRTADVILLNTFYDLEYQVLDKLRINRSPDVIKAKLLLDIGPFRTEEEGDGPDPCLDWLSAREPNSVLFVSFGSMATHSVAQLRELAEGLEASAVSFLWIVRPPDAPGFSAASVAASVTEFLPEGFEERVRGRGLCHSWWAPQVRILKHPAVGGFLSHCGWNSTLEAVCAGVPLLAWPVCSEQHLNRRFLVDTVKSAIELEENEYSKEELESEEVMPVRFISKHEIERKARSLMVEAEGAAVRENMQKLRAIARAATAPGGSSRRNFEAYVQHLHHIAGAAADRHSLGTRKHNSTFWRNRQQPSAAPAVLSGQG